MHHALVLILALPANTPVPKTRSETPATPASASASSDSGDPGRERAGEPTARKLRLAGYVTLVLGCGLLGTMSAAAVFHAQTLARLDARAKDLTPSQRIDPFQRLIVQRELDSARIDRNVAIGAGVSAAVSLALATTLFVLARQRDRPRSRLAVAPTWLPAGAGLTLQLRLR